MIQMEGVDDEIPMTLQSEKKPYRKKKPSTLYHKNLTSGSDANVDEVTETYREENHRQMSLKLTIVTLLVLVSTLVFLILFLIVPLFYSLNHPLNPEVGSHIEEPIERGHSHVSTGAEQDPGHETMKEGEAVDAEKAHSMESAKMNADMIKRISEICQCFAKLVEDGKSQSAMEMTQPAVEVCLRSCFANTSTTEHQGSPTPGPPEALQQQQQQQQQQQKQQQQ